METIEINGNKHYVNYFAHGSFTKAYKDEKGNVLCLVKHCPMKDILVKTQSFQNPHIPKTELLEHNTNTGVKTYKMPYYESIDLSSYTQCPASRLAKKIISFVDLRCNAGDPSDGFNKSLEFIEKLRPNIPETVCDAMQAMVKTANSILPDPLKYDIWFDFGTSNLARENGTLILRDILYSKDMLKIAWGV